MKTTIEFLDELKARNDGASDYAIAKILGVTKGAVSVWRNGKGYFDDSTSIKVANLLKIDTVTVIASVHYERAKKAEEKAVWKGILERLGGIAAALFIGVALFQIMPDTAADPALFLAGLTGAGNIHYTKYRLALKNHFQRLRLPLTLQQSCDIGIAALHCPAPGCRAIFILDVCFGMML